MQKLLLFSALLVTCTTRDIQAMQQKKVTFPIYLPRYAPLSKTYAQRVQDEEEKQALIKERKRQENKSRAEYHQELTKELGSTFHIKKLTRIEQHSQSVLFRQQQKRDRQKQERDRQKAELLRLQQQEATRKFCTSVLKNSAMLALVGTLAYITYQSFDQYPDQRY